jgi:hypothetical protein
LRAAIIAANNNAPEEGCSAGSGSVDVIDLAAIAGETIDLDGTVLPDITTNADIHGNGVKVDAGYRSGILTSSGASDVSIRDLNLTGANEPFPLLRAALVHRGHDLSLFNVRAENNLTSGLRVTASGDIFIDSSEFNDNEFVGMVYRQGGPLFINDSEFSNNKSGGLNLLQDPFTGAIEIQNCRMTGNGRIGVNGNGGNGIFSFVNRFFITNCTLADNRTRGIFLDGGASSNDTSSITGSTISGNLAGGVFMRSVAWLEISNSTITGNNRFAVMVESGSQLFLTHVTLNNTVSTEHAAVVLDNRLSNVSLTNSIVGNTTGGHDCLVQDLLPGPEEVIISGVNLIEEIGNCRFRGEGALLQNVDPMLGLLQNNGGETLSHMLLPDSPAIEAGDNAFAKDAFDQRGPGFPRILNTTVDLGAIESPFVLIIRAGFEDQ